jgi:signal transduction histidine kinase
MRTRIATDLHDDIGANLTKIAILSEVVRQQSGDGDVERDGPLSSIARISRESVAAMGDIVWAINPQRDNLLDLVRRMRRQHESHWRSRLILTTLAPPRLAAEYPGIVDSLAKGHATPTRTCRSTAIAGVGNYE